MKKQLSEEELLKLSPEELYMQFDYLAKATIRRMFPDTTNFASSLGIEPEDLYQFARIGLWKGCTTLHSANHNRTVKGFLIQNTRWAISWHIQNMHVADRIYKSKNSTEDNLVNLISMSSSPQFDDENKTTYYDTVSFDNINNFASPFDDPEKTLVSNDNKHVMLGLLNKLNEDERELLSCRLCENPLTYKEIGEIKGLTKQRIDQKIKKIQDKMRNYLQKEAVAY